MKEGNSLGEITFENIVELKKILEEAWDRGMLEQSVKDIKKEGKSYKKIAKRLGINHLELGDPPSAPQFREWFIEVMKRIAVK